MTGPMSRRPWSTSDSAGESPRATYHVAMVRGLSAEEAGNLVANLAGLPREIAGRTFIPWTIEQIERLLFLRWAYETGRFSG